MLTIGIIIIAIALLWGIIYIIKNESKYDSVMTGYAIGTLVSIGAILIVFKIVFETNQEPTAIDVYNGKTTLEITYRDSVAVDTVVVFKSLNLKK